MLSSPLFIQQTAKDTLATEMANSPHSLLSDKSYLCPIMVDEQLWMAPNQGLILSFQTVYDPAKEPGPKFIQVHNKNI